MNDIQLFSFNGSYADIGGFIIYVYACWKLGVFMGRILPIRINIAIWTTFLVLGLALILFRKLGGSLNGVGLISFITPVIISLILFIIQEVRHK